MVGAAPVAMAPTEAPRRRWLGGCLFGGLALLLICGVGGVLLFLLAGRAVFGGGLRDEIRQAAATEVGQIDRLPVLPTGEVVVSEAEINRQIAGYVDRGIGIEEPRVTITPEGIALTVEAFGQRSSYSGGVAVAGGRLVLTDVAGEGLATRVLSADDIAGIVEDALNDLQTRSDVTVTGVRLEPGRMTIQTAPTGGTPTAGTGAVAGVVGVLAHSGSTRAAGARARRERGDGGGPGRRRSDCGRR